MRKRATNPKREAEPRNPPTAPEVRALLAAVLTGLSFLVLLWFLDRDATLALVVVPAFMAIFVFLLFREMAYRRAGIVEFSLRRLTADTFLWGCVIAGIGAGALRVALSPELWVRRELIFLGVASLLLIMVADAVSWLMRRQRIKLAGAKPG